jgi:hypothetical protein
LTIAVPSGIAGSDARSAGAGFAIFSSVCPELVEGLSFSCSVAEEDDGASTGSARTDVGAGAEDASSPSPAIVAITVPTFTLSVPSGTRIDAIEHLKKLMLEAGVAEDKFKDIDKEIRAIVAESADFAESAPEPELPELYTDVLVEQY